MFISHFNRYFEKHAKLTYFLLLIIIIATFVIFVTPGTFSGGPAGLDDFGEMYGKTLSVELMQKEMAKTTLSLWIAYPQYYGADFSEQKQVLFQESLNRMRILHYAKEQGLDNVSDDEIRNQVAKMPLVQENGAFSKVRFNDLLETVKNRLGMQPVDFDQVVREIVIVERVQDRVIARASVSESEVDDQVAQYTLKCAVIENAKEDPLPSEAEIQDFFATRKSEIVLPDTKSGLVAVFEQDKVQAFLGDAAVSAEEISQYYEINKNTAYKDKSLEECTEEIRKDLSKRKVSDTIVKGANKLSGDFQTLVQDESMEAREGRFTKQAEAIGASVVRTGGVSLDNMISGLGFKEKLANAIRNVPFVGGASRSVNENGTYMVALVTKIEPTAMPDKLAQLGEEQDGLRRLISDAIVREKSLAFYKTDIQAAYDAYMKGMEELQNNRQLSNQQRQQIMQTLRGIDMAPVQEFVVEEKRSFLQVSFAGSAFEAQVAEPTEQEIADAFEARKASFGEKSLEDVKAELIGDLKAAAAAVLANQAAVDYHKKLSDAWRASVQANGGASAEELVDSIAKEFPQGQIRVEPFENLPVSRVNQVDGNLYEALAKATLINPVSAVAQGKNASYVVYLTSIEAMHLADPNSVDYSASVKRAYFDKIKTENSRVLAVAEQKRLTEALAANGGDLAAAAGDLQFTDLPAFSLVDIMSQNAKVIPLLSQQILPDGSFIAELSAVKAPGSVLAPRKLETQLLGIRAGKQGYQLLYVAAREIPAQTEENAEERAMVREQLLNAKQNTEMENFLQTLLSQSNTQLRSGTPYTSAE